MSDGRKVVRLVRTVEFDEDDCDEGLPDKEELKLLVRQRIVEYEDVIHYDDGSQENVWNL